MDALPQYQKYFGRKNTTFNYLNPTVTVLMWLDDPYTQPKTTFFQVLYPHIQTSNATVSWTNTSVRNSSKPITQVVYMSKHIFKNSLTQIIWLLKKIQPRTCAIIFEDPNMYIYINFLVPTYIMWDQIHAGTTYRPQK